MEKTRNYKFPAYSLPKLYGWHMLVKQDLKQTGKTFKYFGANWWDLLVDGKLGLSTGSVTIDSKKGHSFVFINLGANPVKMTNSVTGDVYSVRPGKRSTINNTFDKKITFRSSSRTNKINVTQIGNMFLLLLQVEQLEKGKSTVFKSEVFNDFLLMTGIPDKDQYLNTLGLEQFSSTDVSGWNYQGEDASAKSEWVELLLEQWNLCNPRKKSMAPKGIPFKIHWIWLSLSPDGKKFGKLKPRFYKFMWTWIDRNPEFEYNLWTDNPNFYVPPGFRDVITVRGPSEINKLFTSLPAGPKRDITYLFRNHPNVGARSDTLRQLILYKIGGVYSDINDGACLVSLKKFCEKFDFMIGMEPVFYVNNAIIASKPGHEICKNFLAFLASKSKEFVSEWKRDYARETDQDAKDDYIVSTTGPIAMSQIIFGVLKDNPLPHSLILPSAWIYPNYWVTKPSNFWLKPVSLTAHYDARDYLKS